MKKLRMWVGNLDGTNQGLVITTSKAKAMAIIRCGRTEFDGYWIEKDVDPGIAEYERLYVKPWGDADAVWRQR